MTLTQHYRIGSQIYSLRDVTPVPPSPSPRPLLENENDLTIADLYNEEKNSLFGKVGSSKSEKVKTFLSVQETSEDDSSGSDDDNDEDESEDEDADEEGDEEDEDEDEEDSNTFGEDIGYSKSHPISVTGELKTLKRDTQEDRTERAVASTSAGSGNLTLVSSSLDSVALTEEYISPPVPWNMAVVDRILSGKEIKSTSTLSSGMRILFWFIDFIQLRSSGGGDSIGIDGNDSCGNIANSILLLSSNLPLQPQR